MTRKLTYRLLGSILMLSLIGHACSKSSGGQANPTPVINNPVNPNLTSDVSSWLTSGNKSSLLRKETAVLAFGTTANNYPVIRVDSAQKFQSVDGFGYTLTQGSAVVINQLPAAQRNTLLTEIFGNAENSIRVSYLRIGIGATDLSSTVFSYNDMPAGQTDPTLSTFSIAPDQQVVNLLKEILLINPSIKIMACPWSAPAWMKDNTSTIGGSILPTYYAAYAQYFVKYIQAMQAEGIRIEAITPQNEPLNPANNPSLYMTAAQQAAFIKTNLGPAFSAAGITTKIVIYDHNCDRSDYPLEILNDNAANTYVDGSAFHLYAGDISALSTVHAAHPTKNIYFTEQYTASNGDFEGDLRWHMKNVIIGSMRNWSKNALEWNLANDPSFGPHTPGGCTTCQGALTIGAGYVTKNVAWYIIAQAASFIPAGSIRIASDNMGSLYSVAFLRADGKKVLIVLNDSNAAQPFNISYKGKWVTPTLPAGSVSTYVW